MNIDLEAFDPLVTQPGKRTAADAEQIVASAHAALGLGSDREWRLVSSGMKLTKIFLEVEERTPAGTRRLIGKVSQSKSSQAAFANMRLLWDAGFCPPAQFTVAEPIAFLPDRLLLMQEKAPGVQLLRKVKSREATASDAHCAAAWLTALQEADVEVEPAPSTGFDLDRCRRELPAALPSYSAQIESVLRRIAEQIGPRGPLVPSHGDYHPMNLYIADGRVTAIDLDTLAAREPMMDVAYFLAQSAIMGYLMFGSFKPTHAFRDAFVTAYTEHSSSPFDAHRVGIHVALAFLRSLHYDFCILHTNPQSAVAPFLSAAERCLEGADLSLSV